MAIIGLDKFADFFKGYEECYTIIGGTACDILFSDQPGGFLPTASPFLPTSHNIVNIAEKTYYQKAKISRVMDVTHFYIFYV